MVRVCLMALLVCFGTAMTQEPSPCIAPIQFTMRASQYDSITDEFNKFLIAYDGINKRRVIFEEQDVVIPGRQFREYLILNNENVMYEINLTKKTCTKSMPRRWIPIGIPNNATFEAEYSIGGPGETVTAQEWSDRIPYRQRAYWLGTFSLLNCYPIREVIFADYRESNSTITTNFYDVVEGIPNPNDFIPPEECRNATFALPTGRVPRL